jgi:ribosomal protein S18 acetylase RimI-like enzyme
MQSSNIIHFQSTEVNNNDSYLRYVADIYTLGELNDVCDRLQPNKNKYVLMLISDNKAISMIIYSIMEDYWYVEYVLTELKYRGKGYSKELFNLLIKLSEKSLMLHVFPSNIIAKRFYINLGFRYPSSSDQYCMILEKRGI